MDHLSSTDLDATSKMPLYLGISALILALGALTLGWLGFSKASAHEAALSEVSTTAADVRSKIDSLEKSVKKTQESMQAFSGGVQTALDEASKEISSLKMSLRTVTIQAGTALKKVEDIETAAVRPAVKAPAASSAGSEGGKPQPAAVAGPGGAYVIKKGDYLGTIAGRLGISLDALIAANPDVDPNRLRIGQEIAIPGPAKKP